MRIVPRLYARYILFTIPVLGYLAVIRVLNTKPCSITSQESDSVHSMIVIRDAISANNKVAADFKGKVGTGRFDNSKPFSRKISQNNGIDETGDSDSVNSLPINRKGSGIPPDNGQAESLQSYQKTGQIRYTYDCSNIHLIRLRKKVGHGVSKETYLGEYNGQQVAVKMVTRHQDDVTSCLSDLKTRPKQRGRNGNISQKERNKCHVFPTMKLMKEILLLQQLNHSGLAKLLGFCVRSEETETTDLSEHGVVVVEEFGSRFMLSGLQILPWQERLRHARDLASLLNYLEHSPLGSLIVPDFKESHFLMANSTIKMTDLDDVNNIEPACTYSVHAQIGLKRDGGHSSTFQCSFGLQCQMAMCMGYNAKMNLKNARKLFFKRLLLPSSFPEEMEEDMATINVRLDNLSINADELYSKFTRLLSSTEMENVKR